MKRALFFVILAAPGLGTGWNDALKTCLLWNPAPCTQAATAGGPSSSIRHYAQVVHHLLETRCFGRINNQVRLGLQPKAAAKYPSWRTNYDKILAQVTEQDREHTVQFHDLPERLMWMFMQFHSENEQPWSAMAAAFHTAKHAVKKHVQLL